MDVHQRILFPEARQDSPAAPYNDSHLGWRSPALYLFAGVAAMLALIGFASLILVCTWCRLAGDDMGESTRQPNLETMESGPLKPEVICCASQDDEKVLVIMPGDHKPTFLATQLSSVGPDCL